MEQQTGSKLRDEYVKVANCHPAYLTYMSSTSCEMLGWMKHKLDKIAGRNINNLRYADLYGRNLRGTEEPLEESE